MKKLKESFMKNIGISFLFYLIITLAILMYGVLVERVEMSVNISIILTLIYLCILVIIDLMIKTEIENKIETKPIVSDYGVYKDNKLICILNNRFNAQLIEDILKKDLNSKSGFAYNPKYTNKDFVSFTINRKGVNNE